jgi:hypothetical protein
MITVEISRALWGRGSHAGSALRRMDNGKMCCLGFIAKQAGFTDEQLHGVPFPHCLFNETHQKSVPDGVSWQEYQNSPSPAYQKPIPKILQPFIRRLGWGVSMDHTQLASDLASINDRFLEDELRERLLKERAAQDGYDFVFVD